MAFENKSIDVGSVQNLDSYCGYGTNFANPDEFKLDMSERIHMLGTQSSPFLSWMQKVRVKTATQVFFSWIESEMFTQRDLKCRLVRSTAHGSGGYVWALVLDTAADWMAFAAAAKKDAWASGEYKPLIYLTIIKASDTTKKYSATIEKEALTLGQTQRTIYWKTSGVATSLAGVLNAITVYDTGNGETAVGGAAGELSAIPSNVGVASYAFTNFGTDFNAASTDVYVSISTPNDYLKGYAQGSGLPTESRRTSRSLKNYVQIFKTPYSISNTQKAIAAAGGTYGGDELSRLRLAKAIEHKIDIETAIMFQGGGVEGTDWGELPAVSGNDGENPVTRMKGLGIGLAVNGLTSYPGFIQTKNADLDSRYVFTVSGATMTELNRIMGMVFDDTVDNPSTAKTLFCSQKWLATLAQLALTGDGHGIYVFGERTAAPGELGIMIRSILTPVGRLDCVHLPRLRGKYEDYAFCCDMANMEWRPLVNRNTMLNADTGEKTRDGQLDFFITEGGFECRHESTHAVLKLG